MKKSLLIIGLLSALLVIAFTPSAFASNGPHVGPGFAMDTDGCAGCHRAHTGVQARLLKAGSDRYGFCTSCHDGTGANNNVELGVFEGDQDITYENHNSKNDGEAGMGLNGGGFESAVPYSDRLSRSGASIPLGDKNEDGVYDPNDPTDSDPNLQRHNVVNNIGGDSYVGKAFGGGSTGPTQDISGFVCTSCHDPHGLKNDDDPATLTFDESTTERYRMLKGNKASPIKTESGNIDTVAVIRSNEAAGTHDYTKAQYKEGIADFCIACHTQYKTGMLTYGSVLPATTAYNAGDGQGSVNRYRHAIDRKLGDHGADTGVKGNGNSVWENMSLTGHVKLPVEQLSGFTAIGSADEITCLTCHQSHGTSEIMDASAQVAPANSSTLLRLKNRGVCQDCHNK